ncbi:MAG: hypothetical protein ABI539_08405 [Acidobacteriota bacterium]
MDEVKTMLLEVEAENLRVIAERDNLDAAGDSAEIIEIFEDEE